jgi:predicted alpha/beta-fold hydrolase
VLRIADIDGRREAITAGPTAGGWRVPPFEPHPLLRGGHAQTILASLLPGKRFPYRATQHLVELPDGDQLVLHDDCPAGWHPGGRVAVLLHGIAGSHHSAYVSRASGRLHEHGVRSFRLDFRGVGSGAGLAQRPYHAGSSDDVLAAVRSVRERCPHARIGLVGFSLGGNMLLKMLGESGEAAALGVDRAIAFSPAIDLTATTRRLDGFATGFYDRHIARTIFLQFQAMRTALPEDLRPEDVLPAEPRRVREFDACVTVPLAGFESVERYYAESSAGPLLPRIEVPTLIVTSRDDPLVPVESFESLPPAPAVTVAITERGGHLGFLGRAGLDPDRRWMDWRIVDALSDRLAAQARAA